MMIFQSFVDGVKTTFRTNVITSVYGHFQIFKDGFRQNESDEPFAWQIENSDEIRSVIDSEIAPLSILARRLPFYGLLNYNDRSAGGVGIGIDAAQERSFLTLNQVHSGKHLADAGEESIFIGYKLAERLKISVGDVVTILATTKTGSMNALDLEVVGLFKSGVTQLDEGSYYIHYEVAERLLKVKGASILVVGFKENNELPFKKKMEDVIEQRFPDLELVHWNKLADFFDNTMGWIERMVFVFRTIILGIATISIVTVFMMGLFERIGEFGTLRAIGTHRESIGGMIFVESLLQSTVGSILGVALGALVITLGLRAGISMPPPPMMSVPFEVKFAIPWASIPVTLGLCIVVAGGAGVFPAWRMARIGVVEALGRNV
jgi:putative ABC transport system permease protein